MALRRLRRRRNHRVTKASPGSQESGLHKQPRPNQGCSQRAFFPIGVRSLLWSWFEAQDSEPRFRASDAEYAGQHVECKIYLSFAANTETHKKPQALESQDMGSQKGFVLRYLLEQDLLYEDPSSYRTATTS